MHARVLRMRAHQPPHTGRKRHNRKSNTTAVHHSTTAAATPATTPTAVANGITTAEPNTHTQHLTQRPPARHHQGLHRVRPLHRLPTQVTAKPTASRCKSTRNAAQSTQTGAQHRPPTLRLLFYC